MPLSPGRRLGPYEILAPIGSGGMGEVYRARDVRLDRTIAIKVLPPEFSADPERLKRFEREACAASALNHPNILTIHDVGVTDAVSYIAMEYISGKTLDQLLQDGPPPVKKVLDLSIQLADALAAAHDAGIVHRDLKPSNVMVTKEGLVKVLDFGLAKDLRGQRQSAGSQETTEPDARTGSGVVLGTVGYMSPEQATGNAVDFRSDQFSFGTILYEMATGRRAFHGKTNIDTLSAILHDDPPPIRDFNREIPDPVEWIVRRCLAKETSGRFGSTRDLAGDLAVVRDHLAELRSDIRPAAVSLSRRYWRIAAPVLLLAAAAGLFLFRSGGRPLSSVSPIRFSIAPPENTVFNFASSSPAPPALSPNGRWLAFGARDSEGANRLWIRTLQDLSERSLAGTDGATFPFWSADSRLLGFFADGKLKKIDILEGPPQTVCDAPDGRGGTWSRDGVILFAPDRRGPIMRVSAAGGPIAAATRLDASKTGAVHRWPSFLPDGRHFLFFVRRSDSTRPAGEVWVGSLDSAEARPVLNDSSNAIYAAPGYLLFVREGSLFEIPFDAQNLRTRGSPIPLVRQVQYQTYRWFGVFSAAESGLLLYQGGSVAENSELVWFDRSGRAVQTAFPPAEYAGLRLSPNGRRCAVEIRNDPSGTIDIWLGDLSRGVITRLTSGPLINDSPVWSPDGSRLAFASNRTGKWEIYAVPAAESGRSVSILASDDDKAPTDWSPDGRFLAFNSSGPATAYRWDIRSLSMDGAVRPLIRNSFDEFSGRFSPDGRLLAYASDETGREEIYVKELAGEERRWRVSTSGGSQALWRHDGLELFYIAPDEKLMAVSWRTDAAEIPAPVPLFQTGIRSSSSDIPLFDASPDGTRFLVNTSLGKRTSIPLTLVVNWFAEARK